MSATNDLLSAYQHVISETRVVSGSRGIFDVIVDGDLLYSKLDTGRHARPGEILELFRSRYGSGIREYGT